MTRIPACLVVLLMLGLADGPAARAANPVGPITDPAGDFRASVPGDTNSYAGPQNPGLDVLSANVILDPTRNTLTFTSTMAGPISGLINPTTGGNFGSFSWGINHGYSNLSFPEIGLPGVLFDSVLAVNPNGTASYRGAQAPAGSVTAVGNTLTAILPVSFVAPPPAPANAPGTLQPVADWTYNLWPRSNFLPDGTPTSFGTVPISFGDAQIADFAPNTTDFAAQVVPEPSPALLACVLGTFGGAVCWWRRQRTA